MSTRSIDRSAVIHDNDRSAVMHFKDRPAVTPPKDRASLCSFTLADGCRSPRCDSHPHLCAFRARKEAQLAQSSTFSNFFKMNTCRTASKQTTLSIFRINTYAKPKGRGVQVAQPLLAVLFRTCQDTEPVIKAFNLLARSLHKHKKRGALLSESTSFFVRGWKNVTTWASRHLAFWRYASCCRCSSKRRSVPC